MYFPTTSAYSLFAMKKSIFMSVRKIAKSHVRPSVRMEQLGS